jgi:hypothetical protein
MEVQLKRVRCLVVVPDKVNRSFNLQTATKRVLRSSWEKQ